MGGEVLASDEAESMENIRSDLFRARQQSPATKDPDTVRKFILRTALTLFNLAQVLEIPLFLGFSRKLFQKTSISFREANVTSGLIFPPQVTDFIDSHCFVIC